MRYDLTILQATRGAKTVFPGVASEGGIWKNHEMKALPGARLGQVDNNPCRADMEAAALLAGRIFVINIVRDRYERPVEVVCGHPIEAHRIGVELARPYFEQCVEGKFDTVIVSDIHPVSMSLYQACKMLPVAGRILKPGGTVVICADCRDGVGPIRAVNESIYRLGCVPNLPIPHEVLLASTLSEAEVEPTFARFVPNLDTLLTRIDGPGLAVLPYAANVVPRVREGLNL